MWTSYAVGLSVLVALLAGWVAVQSAWRRVFPDALADPDVLAGRGGCGGCGHVETCERRDGATPQAAAEKEDR
jgi:hypothetical protein